VKPGSLSPGLVFFLSFLLFGSGDAPFTRGECRGVDFPGRSGRFPSGPGEVSADLVGELGADLAAPLGAAGGNPRLAGLVGLGLLGLVAVDQPVRDGIKGALGDNDLIVELSRDFTWMGGRIPVVALVSASVACGWFFHRPYLLKSALLGAESVVIASVWTGLLKVVAGRERPGLSPSGSFRFHGPAALDNEGWKSFPSGHAGVAFALGTVVSNRYPGRPAWLAYMLAGSVAISRLVLDRHWLSDVVAGSAIGYGAGRLVTGKEKDGEEPAESSGRSPRLELGPGRLAFSFKFN